MNDERILGFTGPMPAGRDALGRPRVVIEKHQILRMPAKNAAELLRDRRACDLTPAPIAVFGAIMPSPGVRQYISFHWDFKAGQLGKSPPLREETGQRIYEAFS